VIVPKGGSRSSSQENECCRVEEGRSVQLTLRYTECRSAVSRAVPSLETGKNREERREQSYWLVFTLLTRKGTGSKGLEVTVGGKPMCACLSLLGGSSLKGGPPSFFGLRLAGATRLELVSPG
jgi:hypothetical protein